MSDLLPGLFRGLCPGLCSISFRELTPEAIISLCHESGLECIEWGSDIHAPAGDEIAAHALAKRCSEVGLSCPSYGSYFFAGRDPVDELPPLLDTAAALGAKTVRIWAPFGIGPDAAPSERTQVVDAICDAALLASERDLSLALEFHPGTLTETAASTLDLLSSLGENVFSYWQPVAGATTALSVSELSLVHPRLAHLHVFSWDPTPTDRQPLDHLESMWRAAIRLALRDRGFPAPRCAYLEYLPNDDPDALRRDAAVLVQWIKEESA